MFRHVPVFEHDPKTLIELGNSMIEDEKQFDESLEVTDDDENRAELADGTLRLPAGYTYFGQFVDHDITYDPVSSLTRQNDPNALTDFRTPRFDLDSLYGSGPADEPFLYDADGLELLYDAARHDLQRNAAGRALIGDPRNDENLIVSQLQVAFVRFHNAVVDYWWQRSDLKGSDLFKLVQQTVRWHYQWVVIHDFLPRIVGDDVVDGAGAPAPNRVVADILRTEEYETPALSGDADSRRQTIVAPKLRFYDWHHEPFMPVEFSVAAYRFGHSMARPSYLINDGIDGPDEVVVAGKKVRPKRIPLFDLTGGAGARAAGGSGRRPVNEDPGVGNKLDNLDGFRRRRRGVFVQWKYFLPGIEPEPTPHLPQPSYKLDAKLGRPLGLLPESVATAQVLFGADETEARSLAVRNLLRARALGVPTGQAVARAMGVEPLEALPARRDRDENDTGLRETTRAHPELEGNWPLWYYVLKEAERCDGAHLGPVGGRIVAEVLIGLLCGDPLSYLGVEPNWKPFLKEPVGTFTLSDLVKFGLDGAPRAAKPRRAPRATAARARRR
jgi:hypothetical protein